MDAFGISSSVFGTLGFIFGLVAFSKVVALEKQLNESGLLKNQDKDG